MKIRIASRQSRMPKNCNTWADLSTVDPKREPESWGVRVPLSRKVRAGTTVTVVRLSGQHDRVVLGRCVHRNAEFSYWTGHHDGGDHSADPDGGEQAQWNALRAIGAISGGILDTPDDLHSITFEDVFGYTPGDQD